MDCREFAQRIAKALEDNRFTVGCFDVDHEPDLKGLAEAVEAMAQDYGDALRRGEKARGQLEALVRYFYAEPEDTPAAPYSQAQMDRLHEVVREFTEAAKGAGAEGLERKSALAAAIEERDDAEHLDRAALWNAVNRVRIAVGFEGPLTPALLSHVVEEVDKLVAEAKARPEEKGCREVALDEQVKAHQKAMDRLVADKDEIVRRLEETRAKLRQTERNRAMLVKCIREARKGCIHTKRALRSLLAAVAPDACLDAISDDNVAWLTLPGDVEVVRTYTMRAWGAALAGPSDRTDPRVRLSLETELNAARDFLTGEGVPLLVEEPDGTIGVPPLVERIRRYGEKRFADGSCNRQDWFDWGAWLSAVGVPETERYACQDADGEEYNEERPLLFGKRLEILKQRLDEADRAKDTIRAFDATRPAFDALYDRVVAACEALGLPDEDARLVLKADDYAGQLRLAARTLDDATGRAVQAEAQIEEAHAFLDTVKKFPARQQQAGVSSRVLLTVKGRLQQHFPAEA